MAPFSTPPSVRLLCWSALSLLIASFAQAASPVVDVNGTSIVGVSQTFGGLVGVDFFGGEYAGVRGGVGMNR